MDAKIPISEGKWIHIGIPDGFSFENIPEALVQIASYMEMVCASACINNNENSDFVGVDKRRISSK